MIDRLTYSDSGVNIDEGNKAIKLMKSHITETFSKDVISTIGGFGGLFNLDLTGINNPVLVSGTDGVGTKLLLDYFATGNLEGEKVAEVVKGIANGCKLSGCSLIGGETAEMPGLYKGKEYDLSGFAVGVVDREKLIDGRNIKTGDIIIGLPSSGIHSNGYSLVRKLFFEKLKWTQDTFIEELDSTLGEVLLTPTKIYWDIVSRLNENFDIKGMAHITGGGFYENIPRIIPKGLGVDIDLLSWDRPEIFKLIQKLGNIHRDEMFRTFNMGIGYTIVVSKDESEIILDEMKVINEKAYIIGEIVDTHLGVKLCQE